MVQWKETWRQRAGFGAGFLRQDPRALSQLIQSSKCRGGGGGCCPLQRLWGDHASAPLPRFRSCLCNGSSHTLTNHSPSRAAARASPPHHHCPGRFFLQICEPLTFARALLKCTLLKSPCLHKGAPPPGPPSRPGLLTLTLTRFRRSVPCIKMPLVIAGASPHSPPPGARGQVAQVTRNVENTTGISGGTSSP